MQETHILHQLLYWAFIEMREHSRTTGDKLVYRLSDFFHSVVLDMQRAADGKIPYAQIEAGLKELASERGCALWLEATLQRIADGDIRISDTR